MYLVVIRDELVDGVYGSIELRQSHVRYRKYGRRYPVSFPYAVFDILRWQRRVPEYLLTASAYLKEYGYCFPCRPLEL